VITADVIHVANTPELYGSHSCDDLLHHLVKRGRHLHRKRTEACSRQKLPNHSSARAAEPARTATPCGASRPGARKQTRTLRMRSEAQLLRYRVIHKPPGHFVSSAGDDGAFLQNLHHQLAPRSPGAPGFLSPPAMTFASERAAPSVTRGFRRRRG